MVRNLGIFDSDLFLISPTSDNVFTYVLNILYTKMEMQKTSLKKT